MNTQITDGHWDHWSPSSDQIGSLWEKTGSASRDHTIDSNHEVLDEDQKDPRISFRCHGFGLNTFHIHRNISWLLLIPSTAGAFGINPPFQVTEQVPSPMASSSTADVLDEATTTLIAEVKNMKESKTPQQVEDYIHKLQSLGRHMQLQKFRTWLNKQCGLPIEIRPNNINTKEYMQQDQIEQWINEWTQKNAKGTEQRVLKNFLRMDFAVQPNPKMQPCSSCEQQFMLLFMLLPMKQHNMNTYDPDEHSADRSWADAPQASERQKALNQNAPGMTMAECELRALCGDRGYLPPTWYLATPPNAAVPPDYARWDTESRPSSGSNYHSPKQVKTKTPHSILHMNGNNWSTWCGRPGKHTPNRDSRHIAPPHSKASKMPSSRPNRTSQRGRPVSHSWTIRSFLPPMQEPIYGRWNHNNSND